MKIEVKQKILKLEDIKGTINARIGHLEEDPLTEVMRKSKTNKPYKTYNLNLRVNKEETQLQFLMHEQLNEIIKHYGNDSANWNGLTISITAVDDNGYKKALLQVIPEFDETVI